jgi:hypothetical protein
LRSLTDGVAHVAVHVPDVRVRALPGVGHLAPIVQRAVVAAELIRFFEATPEPV